jgi:hypothetical protein
VYAYLEQRAAFSKCCSGEKQIDLHDRAFMSDFCVDDIGVTYFARNHHSAKRSLLLRRPVAT